MQLVVVALGLLGGLQGLLRVHQPERGVRLHVRIGLRLLVGGLRALDLSFGRTRGIRRGATDGDDRESEHRNHSCELNGTLTHRRHLRGRARYLGRRSSSWRSTLMYWFISSDIVLTR